MSELMARLTHRCRRIKVVAADATPGPRRDHHEVLQRIPAARYQTTAELLRDLESLDANGHPIRQDHAPGGRRDEEVDVRGGRRSP